MRAWHVIPAQEMEISKKTTTDIRQILFRINNKVKKIRAFDKKMRKWKKLLSTTK